MNLGKALQRIRFEKGMNQIDVAKKAKITQTYLSQLETNKKKEPSKAVLQRLCKVYGVPQIVVLWYAVEEGDFQPKKKKIFYQFKPVLDSLVADLLRLPNP